MVYKRFVEIGRVALINDGPDQGKLCVIVDVVDQRRALVDGPCTGVSRQAIGFSKLSLTDFKISISRSAREKQVRKQFDADGVSTRWAETAWARKIARKTCRARLTDFDRYKLKVLRQQRSRIVRGKFNQLKKESSKSA